MYARGLSTPAPTMDADAIRALIQETLRASTAAAVQASTLTVSEMLPGAIRNTMHEQVRDTHGDKLKWHLRISR